MLGFTTILSIKNQMILTEQFDLESLCLLKFKNIDDGGNLNVFKN